MPKLKANSYVGMRMENDVLQAAKDFAVSNGVGLSAAIRKLIVSGLEREKVVQAERTARAIATLQKSVGEYFQLKAVGDKLTLERVPDVANLGRAEKLAKKKETVHA